MTHKLYPRLAWQGITKNKRLYLPFLLTCVGMVMMTYILLSLASSPILQTFPGGDTMPMILEPWQLCHGGVRRAVPVLHEFLPYPPPES